MSSSKRETANSSEPQRNIHIGRAVPPGSHGGSDTKGISTDTLTPVQSTDEIIVIDDSDTEAEVVQKRPRVSTASRKESAEGISSDENFAAKQRVVKQKSAVSGVKFIPTHGSEQDVEAERTMWCDAYAPTSMAELATSKNRVQSVRSWMEEALHGRPSSIDSDIAFSQLARDRIRKYRRILVLSGPAGVGKTTTVQVIAKELNVQVMEWEEGVEEWNMAGQMGNNFRLQFCLRLGC